MEKNQSVRMELPSRIVFPLFLPLSVEDEMDLEGEGEGQRHGGQVGSGREEKWKGRRRGRPPVLS